MNRLEKDYDGLLDEIGFPSPTGVTYYELYIFEIACANSLACFRPQQGLPIMNTTSITI